ncbi:MAG: hypothetical protein KF770_29335 [Anaerolineae bacterium]|nr:hypothetical protein [Anaerolineae bacterium]
MPRVFAHRQPVFHRLPEGFGYGRTFFAAADKRMGVRPCSGSQCMQVVDTAVPFCSGR